MSMAVKLLLLLTAGLVISPVVLCHPDSIHDQYHRETWLKAGSIFESVAFPLRSPVISLLHGITGEAAIPITKTCRSSLIKFSHDLEHHETNAMHMLDSFGKFTPGILKKRRLSDFGHYEQCLSVERARYLLLEYHWPAPANIDHLHVLFQENQTATTERSWMKDYSSKARTCTMYMVPPMIALCVPMECTNTDLQAVLDSSLIQNQTHPFKVRVTV